MKRALLVAALALGACAAPSSYDGLTGGTKEAAPAAPRKEDSTVLPPRALSPLSVSFIASSRPRLRWSLADSASSLTGAIVELSKTRAFASDVKRFEAKGGELVVPEDLALGVWFWRLKGSTDTSFGTATSPVWEMVVRGPAAHGSSDAPTRSMVDMNGDGEPDLLVGSTVDFSMSGGPPGTPPGPPGATGAAVVAYVGDPDRGFAGPPVDGWSDVASAYAGPLAIGGGTDFNGDGLTDLVESGVDVFVEGGQTSFGVNLVYSNLPNANANAMGSSGSTSAYVFDLDHLVPLYIGGLQALPSVREGGDIDGDGYGEALIGMSGASMVVLGAAMSNQHPPLLPVYPTDDGSAGTPPRIALGCFDANADGLSDVVFSLTDTQQASARSFAAAGNHAQRLGDPKWLDAPDAKAAIAFAAGDFNGDGIDDIGITTPVGQSSRVCIWFGNRDKLLLPGPCVAAPAGETSFGASLTGVDLEGDGVDELLATTVAGTTDAVRAIRLDASGAATVAPVGAVGLGVRLTTIWPGRPGKGRWAAVASDGSRVGVFEGTALVTSMLPPTGHGIVGGFGRGLR